LGEDGQRAEPGDVQNRKREEEEGPKIVGRTLDGQDAWMRIGQSDDVKKLDRFPWAPSKRTVGGDVIKSEEGRPNSLSVFLE